MARKTGMTEADLDAAEIRASVEKSRNRLRFIILITTIVTTGYVLVEDIKAPPEPDPSVDCVAHTGQWHPEVYDSFGRHIKGFCDQKK